MSTGNQDELSAEDRIIQARSMLQDADESPFFGYLVLHLEPVKTDEVPTAGVDFSGNLFYNPDFIEDLTPSQAKGLICHEVLHLALEGMKRKGNRNEQLWNIAQDIVINDIINDEGYDLPEAGIIPENHEIDFREQAGNKQGGGQGLDLHIENLTEESFETVYSKVKKAYEEMDPPDKQGGQGQQGQQSGQSSSGDGQKQSGGQQSGDGESGQGKSEREQDGDPRLPQGFDDHIYEDDEDGEGEMKGAEEGDKNWGEILCKAAEHARKQGDLPAGLKERVNAAVQEQVDWRQKLRQFISSQVPYDYEMEYPDEELARQGIYLPSTEYENLDVNIAIDTSGSISDNEIRDFLGEVIAIARTFRNVNIRIIQHDADVQKVEEYDQAKSDDFKEFEIKGRGGTDHRPVFQYLKEDVDSTDQQVLICFTDGYTSVPDPEHLPHNLYTMWALVDRPDTDSLESIGQIVWLDNEYG